MPTSETIKLEFILTETHKGQRLDQVLSQLLPDYSRNMIQNWIKKEQVLVNLKPEKAKYRIIGHEKINIFATIEADTQHAPENIPLNIIDEETDYLIINKPAGLTVHPGAGNPRGTMLNALLHYCPKLEKLPRAGIIHRLDKDTSGIIVIAKTVKAYQYFIRAMASREIKREYRAVVNGHLVAGATIEAAIGRHPTKRTRMAVVASGKPAVTHYRILEKLASHTYLRVILETGRTHQIRVHMAYIQHPLVGDQIYGRRPFLPKNASEKLKQILQKFPRQALHAYQLTFKSPQTQSIVSYYAALPHDFKQLLIALGCQTL
ncbi:MAG: 23S rRNA pseudouridine(1911/1915/1917) synthase RluD [Pseudomonadota bacterium]